MRRDLLGCGATAMLLSSFDLIERRIHGKSRRAKSTTTGAVSPNALPVSDAVAGDVESLRAGLDAWLPTARRMTVPVADLCRSGWQ
ncbi:hypothetical protein [Paracoccus jeotgali]|uniref:Uncharacterized protein n=1 Tax=Paracoccus jeotgali TaxID=2065379 RepID=A0A2K9MJF2_9RHOB|nr:hypothetical protein [Paracoccus jeotgali]AUM75156.1 hypothetical protein CYR75_13410 [Paracoccus jeotgali]